MVITIFTITETSHGYDIKSKKFPQHNRSNVHADELFSTMAKLSELLNNEHGIAVAFEID